MEGKSRGRDGREEPPRVGLHCHVRNPENTLITVHFDVGGE